MTDNKRKGGAPAGNTNATWRHGAYAFLARGAWPPCNKCQFQDECDLYLKDSHCRLFEAIECERKAEIMALDHIRPEHGPLVTLYVRNLSLVGLIDMWLSRVSPFRGTGKRKSLNIQDVLRIRWTSENAATRQAAELCLTPASRERLGLPRDFGERPTIHVGGSRENYIAKLREARKTV